MPVNYANRWIVISGVRDIALGSMCVVAEKMREIIAGHPAGIIFGGARVVDTAALRFAHDARVGEWTKPMVPPFVVVVPCTVSTQPIACARTIRECADEIIEMHLPLSVPSSYHARNTKMLKEAMRRTGDPLLVAFFCERRLRGGTRATMERAAALGVEVEPVPVEVTESGKD